MNKLNVLGLNIECEENKGTKVTVIYPQIENLIQLKNKEIQSKISENMIVY